MMTTTANSYRIGMWQPHEHLLGGPSINYSLVIEIELTCRFSEMATFANRD